MPTYAACLIDIFDTALSVDFARRNVVLAERAGVDPATIAAALDTWSRSVMDGTATIETVLKEVLCDRCSADDALLSQLVADDRARLPGLSLLHDDTVPFLESLRTSGIRTAFVSNCADDARPLLETLGLHHLVDELVLSCEIGASKPDPSVYQAALERLNVPPDDALFVDDQQANCDGAVAVGIRAVLIDRFNGSGEISDLTSLLRHF
jgi:HAD superfamily hydrolase (TIGR01509 family)